MINVISKVCKHENCLKQPTYNFEGKNPLYCFKHKKEGMVDVKSNRCILCDKQPIYNYPGEKKKLYCSDHRFEDMIDIRKNKCEHENCNKRPSYSYEGYQPKYCSGHKIEGMVDTAHRSCKQKDCFSLAIYNIEGKGPIYCVNHKKEDMIDTNNKNKRCLSEFCSVFSLGKKYDNYCTHCFANLFPNDPRTLLIKKKSKEIKVVSFITNKYSEWFHDKPLYVDLKGGCCNSKRRIDLRKLIDNTLLCIEIDENQHKFYNKQDEKDRYDNLFMDFSGKYIFIRYNPDKFKIGEKSFNPRFEKRMEKLEEEIEKQIKRIKNCDNKNLIEIIKLFYDID